MYIYKFFCEFSYWIVDTQDFKGYLKTKAFDLCFFFLILFFLLRSTFDKFFSLFFFYIFPLFTWARQSLLPALSLCSLACLFQTKGYLLFIRGWGHEFSSKSGKVLGNLRMENLNTSLTWNLIHAKCLWIILFTN